MTPQELIAKGGETKPLEAVAQDLASPKATETPVVSTETTTSNSDEGSGKFDFAAFEKVKGNAPEVKSIEPTKVKDTPTTEKLEPVVEKEEAEEPEVEPEKPAVEDEDLPVTAKPILAKPPIDKQLKEEGLDSLPEELKPIFKQMGKPAREWAKARLKENEELRAQAQQQASGKLPNNWFDHEEAYQLHPEYTKSVGIARQAEGFINFWTEQYRKIKEGENWENVTLDQQTGKFNTQLMKPGAEAEVYVQRQLAIETNAHQQFLRNAEQIKQNFVAERGNIVKALQDTEQRFFPQYVDPKSYEPAAKAVQGVLDRFNQRGNVLGSFLTKLYAFSMEQDKVIKDLQKKIENKVSAKTEQTKAGPSYDELQGGKAKVIINPEEKPFDANEFEKYKSGF